MPSESEINEIRERDFKETEIFKKQDKLEKQHQEDIDNHYDVKEVRYED